MNAEEKERYEEGRWRSQPQTPKELRTHANRGLMMFTRTYRACPKGRCAKPENHQAACWPI